MEQKKYHYFYKITNIKNGYYYYGIHSTDNINDGYMGSGRRLKRAMKKYGKEKFQKEIVVFFNTREEASEYEENTVNEVCVKDVTCYNLKKGGDYGVTVGTVLVKDKNNVFYRCKPDDEDYLNGTLVPVMSGCIAVIKKDTGERVIIPCSEYETNKQLYNSPTSGKVSVKDSNGKTMCISCDSNDYKNGVLVPIWKGRHHNELTKQKMSETHKNNGNQIGEKNSQYGTCWITKDGINKKIKKQELESFVTEGWKAGRHVGEVPSKFDDTIDVDKLVELLKNGTKKKDISKFFNIPKTSLSRFIKKHNL